MGKRKRRSDQNTTPPPPDIMPYSSRMDSLSKEKSSHSVDSSTIRSLASIMDIMDSSGSCQTPTARIRILTIHYCWDTRGISMAVNTLGEIQPTMLVHHLLVARVLHSMINSLLSLLVKATQILDITQKTRIKHSTDQKELGQVSQEQMQYPLRQRWSVEYAGGCWKGSLLLLTILSHPVMSQLWQFLFVGMFIMQIVWNREQTTKRNVTRHARYVQVCSRSLMVQEGRTDSRNVHSEGKWQIRW